MGTGITRYQKKYHIRKDDLIQVITGKEMGKTGKVIRVLKNKDRVLVERLNMVKRHVRPSQQNPQGGIIEKEAPIHVSNVMVFCPKCARGIRIGKMVLKDGKKVRICKNCGEMIDK